MIKNLYRISLNEAGLEKGYFISHGLPSPISTYQGFSERLPKSTGGDTRQGYKNATWQWVGSSQLTPSKAYIITSLIESALSGSGLIYITLPRANGEGAGLDWVDCSGVPQYPDIQTFQNDFNNLVLQSVTLTINNITIVNNPSTVVT